VATGGRDGHVRIWKIKPGSEDDHDGMGETDGEEAKWTAVSVADFDQHKSVDFFGGIPSDNLISFFFVGRRWVGLNGISQGNSLSFTFFFSQHHLTLFYIGLYFHPQETMVVFACGRLHLEMFGDQQEVLGWSRQRN